MENRNYIYNVNYQDYEESLCLIEQRALFDIDLSGKVFFSNNKVRPTTSIFIKNRLEIIYKAQSFSEILKLITRDELVSHEFMVKYVTLTTDDPYIKEGKKLCKEIGLIIHGFPSFKSPKITYGITHYDEEWYFGLLESNNSNWKNHKSKPYSYSSSLGLNTAKTLVNLAGKGDLSKTIIDPCCGVGTVLLEAHSAGYNITGREINEKVADNARKNLLHFDYPVEVITGDIKDINANYDVSIVDLPYGIFSKTDTEDQMEIIRNAKRISKKLILVSSKDIKESLIKENLIVADYCKVHKCRNRDFGRYIWICYSNE